MNTQKPHIGNEMNMRPSSTTYVPSRASRRAVIFHSELLRIRSERFDIWRDQMPVVKAGIEKGQVDNWTNTIAYGLLIVTILGAISAVTSFVNWAVFIYAVIVLIIKLPSQRIFTAALISLVLIPCTSALHRNTLANDFAVITFYFLLIGLIRAIIESRMMNKSTSQAGL
jgi:uncharacterized membrane protein